MASDTDCDDLSGFSIHLSEEDNTDDDDDSLDDFLVSSEDNDGSNVVVESKTMGAITVSLVKGEMVREKVDVIVNSTSQDLDLSQGASSRELLRVGGQGLQQECQNNYPGGVTPGDLAVISGGKLQCKQVFNLTLTKYNGEEAEKLLSKVTMKILKEADSSRKTSVAFPALGTGFNEFPANRVAKIMFRRVEKFGCTHPNTTLTDVRFVIYPKSTAVYKAFEAESKKPSVDRSDREVCKVTINKMTVKLIVGHLTKQQSGAIVCTATRGLKLDKGTLSKNVSGAAGPGLQQQCTVKYPQGIQHGQLAALDPGDLAGEGIQHVYFVSLPRHDKPGDCNTPPAQVLEAAVKACLEQAQTDKVTSMEFPALGSGYLMFPQAVSAKAMLSAMKGFSGANANSCLTAITIVLHGDSTSLGHCLKAFESELKASHMPSSPVPAPRPSSNKAKPVQVQAQPAPAASKDTVPLTPSNKPVLKKVGVLPGTKPIGVKAPTDTKKPNPVKQAADSASAASKDPAPAPAPTMKGARRDSPRPGSMPVLDRFKVSPDMKPIGVKLPAPVPIKRPAPPAVEAMPARNTPEFCMMKYQAEIHTPGNWTTFTNKHTVKEWKMKQKDQSMFELVPVDSKTEAAVKQLVYDTWESAKVGHGRDAGGLAGLNYTNVTVTKVERVENLNQYEKYAQAQQNIFHRVGAGSTVTPLGKLSAAAGKCLPVKTEASTDQLLSRELYPEVNECYLFHGTKEATLDAVLRQGIDPRMASGSAMFGQAVYMAESSTKADQYTDSRSDRKSMAKMLLVRATLGNICLMKEPKKLRKTPCIVDTCGKDDCSHERRYDSIVCDGKWIFREFILYEDRQAYPEYVIHYTRQ